MASLQGKVALVTGASRGIGRAIAERLARDGASVVVNYAKGAEGAAGVVKGIEGSGGKAIAVQANIANVAETRRLFDKAIQHFGGLDIVVNNAGVAQFKPLVDVTEEEFDSTFAVNARGTFFAMQEAVKRLRDGGRIINISTGGAVRASATASVYGGSKAVVDFFTRVLAKEIGARQITVNVVSPGATETDMLDANPQFKQIGVQLSPLGRLGKPSDIASVVAFIASDEGGWITGQVIQAGGGMS